MAEEERMTKEQWIQRVKEEGRDQVIREEMIRLGFWEEKPLSPEEEEQIEREKAELKQLQFELDQLSHKSKKLGNIDEWLKLARKKRIQESKQRRERQKKERAREIKDAKQRWKEYTTTHIVHAGVGVSAGLQFVEFDEEKLIQQNLPLIRSSLELATHLGISLSKLKWLTFHRGTATICHYTQFTIPKKNGGKREISAPKPDLRKAQQWVKEQILDVLPVHPKAFGFVPGKSTVDNAKQHLGRAAVIKMDLEDFFPTITFPRVKGWFRSLGYSGQISTLLALLCTEPPRKQIKYDGKYYYMAMGERQLPQGACTSPGLTNLICRRMDERLAQLAASYGFTYSRYADDLTFSCDRKGLSQIGTLLHEVRQVIRFEGFRINQDKTRILRAGNRQKVTGIVVNEKPNIPRKELRAFRALLHNVEKNGLEKENRHGHPDFWGYIQGYCSYIQMVRPDLGARFFEQVQRIGEKYGYIQPVEQT